METCGECSVDSVTTPEMCPPLTRPPHDPPLPPRLPPPPPRLPPPPPIPVPPPQPGPCGSASMPVKYWACGGSSSDETRPIATDAAKTEITTAIQKLLKWGMCRPEDDTLWVASNQHTAPILQQGPECGLVALCMAVNMLEPYTSVTANKGQIMGAAKEKGFTIQGEMFSARNLLALATDVCRVRGEVLEGSMIDNREDILCHLAKGWPVLVPYDKDGNCEPCCRRGHRAHWAVITGFVLYSNRRTLPDLRPPEWQQDPGGPDVYHPGARPSDQSPEVLLRAIREILQSVPASGTYVLARQGKSRHVHPWSYPALSGSNADLLELGSNIEKDIGRFVIPEGGIQAGLCDRVVLLRP